MANVSVGLPAIQQAQAICNGVIQDLNGSAQKLNQRYNDAGQRWKDSKYKQLGGIISDCSSALRSPIEELFDILKKLAEIEKVLVEYESINL